MLSTSSPVTFPSSSPVAQPPPKRRIAGPFIFDDDDSEDEAESLDVSHKAKRRMLHAPVEKETAPDANAENTAHTQSQNESQSSRTEAPEFPSRLTFWPDSPAFLPSHYKSRTCSGQTISIKERRATVAPTYESMVAARSRTKEGRAIRSYYGIDIHDLISQASAAPKQNEQSQASILDEPMNAVMKDPATVAAGKKSQRTLLWTEKYRARSFMDLCGDDGTNRLVLRWLKRWDPLVFSRAVKPLHSASRIPGSKFKAAEEEKPHRKILLLTGPPGLGKTTLAHVCARQAGYEVMEINASDDRSRDVVNDRIRTSLGTQSVKTVSNTSRATQKSARPLCVIVDEVDGVTSGSGTSGEGGFVKALIDLIHIDEKNATASTGQITEGGQRRRKKKGDDFRQMRPLILICNDVYHPSLRPLRHSNLAEIIHVGRPSMDAVVVRLKTVFEKESIPCEKDAVRKLCEAAWGVTGYGADTKRGAESTVEGDLRGIMVVGEWVAGRFRTSSSSSSRTTNPHQVMTRHWVETKVLQDVANGAGGARGIGHGNVRDIVTRLFQEGAGFPKQALEASNDKTNASKTRHENPRIEHGIGEQLKRQSTERLSQMINTSGEINNIITSLFAEYPNRDFNDDCYLTKPNQAYDWLHFHDVCQSRLYSSQEWELAPYLCQPILACHHLFASPKRHHHHQPQDRFTSDRRKAGEKDESEDPPPTPFSGPRADHQAREAERHNRAQLQSLHGQLNPWLMRAFRSADDLAADFIPYLARILSPDVKPVVVGGSQGGAMASVRREVEKVRVKRASQVLAETGITLQKGKVESDGRGPQYVYRMDPDIDALSTFETSTSPPHPPTRYAIRQVLDQELQRTLSEREASARQARFQAGGGGNPSLPHSLQPLSTTKMPSASYRPTKAAPTVKRDFFGRVIVEVGNEGDGGASGRGNGKVIGPKVWVTYHEGLNNAVRKPISLHELLRGL
ncbi:hypothetical protein CP533_1873 [Ophiocordyceps camponoti-saundersi (nom. inval.)]|nr:hypothetical protein CP533_1873 [Ophiocordyceps camponoti-saundersi (nom. inval.)]